jgi:ATP-binding cassette, subfamily C, bacterial CydD
LMAFQSRLQNALDYSGSIKNIKALLKSLDANKVKENFYNKKLKKIETSDAQIKLLKISKSFQQKIIFKNYSLSIMKHRAYAIVGKSGSGKSTLIDLLLGTGEPDEGKVVSNLTPDEVGYVCQNPTVFNASIIENITLGEDFKFDEISFYIDKFELRDDIENLPNGFNTIIGKAGESLSGGQIQRLSIIRELIKKPKLIVLDEYTSALDSRMEKIIHDYILSLKNKMTIVVITHRDYPQNGADEIIKL